MLKIDAQKYPQLCWLLWDHKDKNISEEEAFYAYDKSFRFLDVERMDDVERAFFNELMHKFGSKDQKRSPHYMINFKTISAHTLHTSAILRNASLNASGWAVNRQDETRSAGPQTFGYIWDQSTGWVWMVSAPREDFSKLALKASTEPSRIVEDVRGALAHLIHECAATRVLTSEQENQLGGMLASYAGTTKVWEASDRMQSGGHFIVMNYRKSDQVTSSLLRPFIVADCNNEAIDAADLMSRVEYILAMDRDKHPEWFI